MPISETPLPRVETVRSRLALPEGSAYVYRALADEDRGYLGDQWIQQRESEGTRFFDVSFESLERVAVEDSRAGTTLELSLFDIKDFVDQLVSIQPPEVWIDITGLAYSTWAVFIREMSEAGLPLVVTYTEPAEYTRSLSPLHGLRFNLSDRTSGLAPLPGFARLWPTVGENALLVPFLGFEGDRLQRVLEETDFDVRRTFPIVGAPGFRPEYTFYSLDGNGRSLDRAPMHRNVRYARANCPFEAFLAVEDLRRQENAEHVTLAPIGTKPHAVGALLQQIRHPTSTALVYDHPVRSQRRTTGSARLCVYRISEFLETLDAA